jgi:hypothetical protein
MSDACLEFAKWTVWEIDATNPYHLEDQERRIQQLEATAEGRL